MCVPKSIKVEKTDKSNCFLSAKSLKVGEKLEFFAINYGSYQPFNFSHYLTLSTQYPIFITLTVFYPERQPFSSPNPTPDNFT